MEMEKLFWWNVWFLNMVINKIYSNSFNEHFKISTNFVNKLTWAGFKTTVFPAANNGPIFQANIING